MPTYATPAPISARLELGVAEVRLAATDRADTTVEIKPHDRTVKADVQAAERTTVDFDDGTLTIRTPRQRVHLGRGRPGCVEVVVELPTGSRLRGEVAVGTVRASGRLGDCDITSASGDVRLEEVADLTASTAAGNLAVERVTGAANVGGAAGATRIGTVDGAAVIKGAVGTIRIGTAAGRLRISSASGDISVERALAEVVAKTAAGRITVGEANGSVVVETGGGSLTVGIPAGTAAWVDARSVLGRVRNELEPAGAPGGEERTVEVRARTTVGDISIVRSTRTPTMT